MEGYYYEFVYEYMSIDGVFIVDFLNNIAQTFVPKRMLGDEMDFNKDSITEIGELEFKSKALLITDPDGGYLNVSPAVQNKPAPRRFYNIIRFGDKRLPLSEEECNFFLNRDKLKIAFVCDSKYHFLQTTDNPSSYILAKLDPGPLPKYFNQAFRRELIDVSQNPGREIMLPGFKFVAAFKIWFGKEAIALLGKEKILGYPGAVYVKENDNGLIEMQLFEDPAASGSEENQRRQKDIIAYFELDKLEVPRY
jgi:hypothetical protein